MCYSVVTITCAPSAALQGQCTLGSWSALVLWQRLCFPTPVYLHVEYNLLLSFAAQGTSAYLEKKKLLQKEAKKQSQKASKQRQNSCKLMHYLSQHGHDLNSQPQDACSVNLSDDEPDVAPAALALQPVSRAPVVAASADAVSCKAAGTANDAAAQGQQSAASAVPSAVIDPEAAAAAAAAPPFSLPEAVTIEPADLLQLQWPDMLAHPAAVLIPATCPSAAGQLPPELRAEAAHKLPEETSAVSVPEDASADIAAAGSAPPEVTVAGHVQVPELQWPGLSAHPAAATTLADLPILPGRLQPELQAEAAYGADSVSKCGGQDVSSSQQLTSAEVDRVLSPEQDIWPQGADEADPGDIASMAHGASQQASIMMGSLQVLP